MRSRIARAACGVLLASLVVAGLLGAEPAKETDGRKIAELIRQLGHEEFARREAAGRELEAVGEKALTPLREAAAGSDDPEVRWRAPGVVRAIMWSVRTSRSTGLELVPLGTREFLMGSPQAEGYRRPDEKQHAVRLTRPFLLGVNEVTQGEYRKVMKAGPSWFAEKGGGKAKVEGLDTTSFPVESVTWYDAIEFCNRLSKLDGFEPYYKITGVKRDGDSIAGATVAVAGGNGYRLPTEAEWEYGCRAGWNRPYHFGSYGTGREGNFKPAPDAGGYGGSPSWNPLGRTAKTRSYKPSGWNLYDMHGNVGEWCWDWYDKDYPADPRDDPTGPDRGTQRVVRSGSWMVPAGSCRSASRFSLAPDERKDFVGFRVARTP